MGCGAWKDAGAQARLRVPALPAQREHVAELAEVLRELGGLRAPAEGRGAQVHLEKHGERVSYI